MEHLILNNGSDSAALAKVALKALREARRSKTSNSGSVFVSDGKTDDDGIALGTGTIVNGVNGGIQPWVGDTTAPGKPTGITAESHNGAIWVSWDGTLEGGIPADFDHVQFTAVDGSKKVDMGRLSAAGKVTAAELTAGDEVVVTAVAFDDAHDENGNSKPNASPISDAVPVIVQSAVSADEVQAIQSDLSKAKSDIAAAKASMTDLTATVSSVDGKSTTSGSAPTADDASGKPDGAMWYVMDANGNITGTYILKSGAWVKYAWASSSIADEVNNAISDAASKASTAQSTADAAKSAAETNTNDLTSFISETSDNLSSLQSQVDGSITTWFYGVAPTASNKPAVDWTTTDLKNNHLGDLYYDTVTGYCYRYQVANNTYSWARISDVDVTKALSDAAKAQDTADAKRRVFTSTPSTPYDVGDLWVQGASGDILTCATAKTGSQSYNAADWKRASKYTDDTLAGQANQAAVTAQTSASTAQTAADNAKTLADAAQNTANQALANAQELAINGALLTGDTTGWRSNVTLSISSDDSDGRGNVLTFTTGSSGYAWINNGNTISLTKGHTYRISLDVKPTETYTIEVCFQNETDLTHIGSKTFSLTAGQWNTVVVDYVAVKNFTNMHVYMRNVSPSNAILFDNLSVKDITEAQAAQKAADDAQSAADLALANAQELVRNPTMRSDVSNPDGWPGNVTLGASGAPSNPPTPFTTYAKVTGRDHSTSWTLPNIPGRVFQYTIYAVADSTATQVLQFGAQCSDTDGKMYWAGAIKVGVAQGQAGWAKYVGTFTVPDNISTDTNYPRPWLQINGGASDSGWYVTGLSIKDITEAKAAQSTADTARTIASAAQSAASTAQSSADAAQDAADAAQKTADGKNKVVRSTSAPSSTSGYSNGDQWWVYSGGTVTALYLYDGTAWVSQTLTDSVIANLDAGKITSGYVNADRIQAGSITGSKIAAGTINASNMVAGTLTADSGIIADAAIGSAQIIDGSIGSAKIADAAVGTAKIADAAISSAKIADASITNAKISNLDAGKITSGYVDAARIQAGTIDAGKLASDSVTSDKIVANSVTSDKLVANAVTADKLAANSVTARQLASKAVTADKADIGSLSAAIVSSDKFKTSGTSDYTIVNDSGVTVYKGGKAYAHLGSDTTYGLQTWNPFSNSMTDVSLMSFGAASIVETSDQTTASVSVKPHANNWTPWKDLGPIQENGSWKRFRSPSGRFFVALVMGYKGKPAADFVYLCGNINFKKNNSGREIVNDYPSTHAIPSAGLAADVFNPTPFVGLITVEPNVDYSIHFSFRSAHLNTNSRTLKGAYGHCNYRRLFIMPV